MALAARATAKQFKNYSGKILSNKELEDMHNRKSK